MSLLSEETKCVIILTVPEAQRTCLTAEVIALSDLQKIFYRALNTWDSPSPELLRLADAIDEFVQTTKP